MKKRTTRKTQMEILKSDIARFDSLRLAKGYRDRCLKMNLIVLGDDGKFWVAYPRDRELTVIGLGTYEFL